MDNKEIFSRIDHTALKAFTTWDEIKKLCEEAIEHKMASVCVPPSYIKRIKDTFSDKINVCTVRGFPLGYNSTDVKVFEAKKAIEDGACEEEKIKLCQMVTDTGADYIKTGTGFGTGGASIDDIRLFKQNIGSDVKMKASGGVRTKEDMEAYINEGCSRIGTSSAITLIN